MALRWLFLRVTLRVVLLGGSYILGSSPAPFFSPTRTHNHKLLTSCLYIIKCAYFSEVEVFRVDERILNSREKSGMSPSAAAYTIACATCSLTGPVFLLLHSYYFVVPHRVVKLVLGSLVDKRPRKCEKHWAFELNPWRMQCIVSVLQGATYSCGKIIFLKASQYLTSALTWCAPGLATTVQFLLARSERSR